MFRGWGVVGEEEKAVGCGVMVVRMLGSHCGIWGFSREPKEDFIRCGITRHFIYYVAGHLGQHVCFGFGTGSTDVLEYAVPHSVVHGILGK